MENVKCKGFTVNTPLRDQEWRVIYENLRFSVSPVENRRSQAPTLKLPKAISEPFYFFVQKGRDKGPLSEK